MASAALDAPTLPDGLGRLLASRAEGVPFLVEEVLASCVASGALVRERGVWELRTERAPTTATRPACPLRALQPGIRPSAGSSVAGHVSRAPDRRA